MKRIAMLTVMAFLSLSVSARSVHYFTRAQALRTVSYLNSQNELMIYCGYEYEIPTYVLLNEVWMERVNSSYFELWVYGYDAYTGDEVYMPIDLDCIWLFSGSQIYNAAQYLRFRVTVHRPTFSWHVPPYNSYARVTHRGGYSRTYHYDVHRRGWMPPAYTYGPRMPPPPLPHYYMRKPSAPAPMPSGRWTPGSSKPTVVAPNHGSSTSPRVESGSRNSGTSRNTSSATTTRGTSTSTPAATPSTRGTSTSTSTRTTSPASSRSSATTETSSRSSASGSSRGSATTTGTSSRSSATATGTSTRSSATTTGTSTRRGSATTPSSRTVSERSRGKGETAASRGATSTLRGTIKKD